MVQVKPWGTSDNYAPRLEGSIEYDSMCVHSFTGHSSTLENVKVNSTVELTYKN